MQIARALDPSVHESAPGPGNRTAADAALDFDVSVDPVSCWVDYAIRGKVALSCQLTAVSCRRHDGRPMNQAGRRFFAES